MCKIKLLSISIFLLLSSCISQESAMNERMPQYGYAGGDLIHRTGKLKELLKRNPDAKLYAAIFGGNDYYPVQLRENTRAEFIRKTEVSRLYRADVEDMIPLPALFSIDRDSQSHLRIWAYLNDGSRYLFILLIDIKEWTRYFIRLEGKPV